MQLQLRLFMGMDQAVVILWHESLDTIEQPNLVSVLLVPMAQDHAPTPHQSVGMPVAMMFMSMEISMIVIMLVAATSLLLPLLLLLAHSNQHLRADREPQWLCDAAHELTCQGNTS